MKYAGMFYKVMHYILLNWKLRENTSYMKQQLGRRFASTEIVQLDFWPQMWNVTTRVILEWIQLFTSPTWNYVLRNSY